MSPTEIAAWTALILAVGGSLTTLYTKFTSATAESVKQRNAEIDAQFARLTAENTQQAEALATVRQENIQLFKDQTDMRREMRAKDDEIFQLKRDLATEKVRTSELEFKVNVLTAERDSALERANGKRPGTGPLSDNH